MWQTFLYYFTKLSFTVVALATVCSLLNVLVYDRQQRQSHKTSRKREVHVSFLMAICVSDGLFTLCKVISYTCDNVAPGPTLLNAHLDTILDVYGLTAFRRAAVWLNALASVERFLTIAFPLGTASYVFKRAPAAVISTVFVTCCLAHIFILFEFTVTQDESGGWRQVITPYRAANEAMFESIKNAVRIVFFYIPLFGSLLINLLLLAALKKHVASKKGMTTSRGGAGGGAGGGSGGARGADGKDATTATDSKQNKNVSPEAKAAKLILVLTLTFFFMALPSTLNATVATFTPHYGVPKRELFLYAILLNVFSLVMYLTQPALLIVSLVLSHRFRAALVAIVCRCRQLHSGSHTDVSGLSISSGVTSQSSIPSVTD
nr:hypothetical protein BaRGS_035287 [Batillaria attramentaria]